MARVFENDKSKIDRDMAGRIKVVWICTMRNEFLRSVLPTPSGWFEKFGSKIFNKTVSGKYRDAMQWNTNGVNAMKNFPEIDLHVIIPWRAKMKRKVYTFKDDIVTFHAFFDEEFSLVSKAKRAILRQNYTNRCERNSATINEIINQINPDIVHLIGAEVPNCASSVLNLDAKYPLVVSLQTLMSEPGFFENYSISKKSYDFRSGIEREVIKKADYIASGVPKYLDFVKENINPKAILNGDVVLPLAEDLKPFNVEKEYDFVYFANGIEKAFDLVVEALGIVCKIRPDIKLNVSGSYSPDFRNKMDARLKELGCIENVIYTGVQKSHEDVLRQVCKSRFAVLPLKVDLISGTIRESLAMGLPVITTITPATPEINNDNETVLLSETGDHQALADNMLRLLNENDLANRMTINGFKYMQKKWPSNNERIEKWIVLYRQIVQHKE